MAWREPGRLLKELCQRRCTPKAGQQAGRERRGDKEPRVRRPPPQAAQRPRGGTRVSGRAHGAEARKRDKGAVLSAAPVPRRNDQAHETVPPERQAARRHGPGRGGGPHLALGGLRPDWGAQAEREPRPEPSHQGEAHKGLGEHGEAEAPQHTARAADVGARARGGLRRQNRKAGWISGRFVASEGILDTNGLSEAPWVKSVVASIQAASFSEQTRRAVEAHSGHSGVYCVSSSMVARISDRSL